MSFDQNQYLNQARTNYFDNLRRQRESQSEGSSMWGDIDQQQAESTWGQMTQQQQLQAGYGTIDTPQAGQTPFGLYQLAQDDPNAAAFTQRFGTRDFGGVELNNQALSGLVTGYGAPRYGTYDSEMENWAQDASRIMYLDDESVPADQRRWIMEAANINPQAIVRQQATADDSGLGDMFPAVGLGLVLGGGMLFNAMGAGGAAGAGSSFVPAGEGLTPSMWGGMEGGSLGAGSLTPGVGTGSGLGLNVGTGLGTDLSLGSSITGVSGLPGAAGAAPLGTFAPAAGGALGGAMDWSEIIRGGLNLIGSRNQSRNGARGAEADQRAYNEAMWARALQANRPNQSTPWMNSTWSQDPQTGQWTQTQSLNPQDQQRLDMFRGIAQQRMQAAQTPLQLNWNAINPRVAQWMQGGGSMGGNQLNGGGI